MNKRSKIMKDTKPVKPDLNQNLIMLESLY